MGKDHADEHENPDTRSPPPKFHELFILENKIKIYSQFDSRFCISRCDLLLSCDIINMPSINSPLWNGLRKPTEARESDRTL